MFIQTQVLVNTCKSNQGVFLLLKAHFSYLPLQHGSGNINANYGTCSPTTSTGGEEGRGRERGREREREREERREIGWIATQPFLPFFPFPLTFVPKLTCSEWLPVRLVSFCRHGYGPTSSRWVRERSACRGPARRHSGTDVCTVAPGWSKIRHTHLTTLSCTCTDALMVTVYGKGSSQ